MLGLQSLPIRGYFNSTLFDFPPSSLPATVVPPIPATKTIMQPFNIPSSLYLSVLEPQVPLTVAAIYLAAAVTLNRANAKQGKPWTIATSKVFPVTVVLHNIFLALYSAWTCIGLYLTIRDSGVSPFLEAGWSATVDSLCRMHGPSGVGKSQFFSPASNGWHSLETTASLVQPDAAQGRLWNQGLGYYGWLFYLSKFYEVTDTLIILAKGRRTSVLQTYHHAGAMLCVWVGIRYMSAPIWLFVFINSFIHALMYTYYALGAVGVRVPRALKRALTTMQIVQLFTGTFYSFAHLFIQYRVRVSTTTDVWQPCLTTAGEAFAIVVNLAYLLPLIYLFVRFFIKSYLGNK